MTSGRFWMMAAVLAGAVLGPAVGCGGGGTPCTTCAPIEGRYPLEFAAGTLPSDCVAGVALPTGPLDIQRSGNGLTATLDAVPMQGTLYQSTEFNLLGSQALQDGGSSTQFSISGTYTAGKPDGGLGQIAGSFTGTYTRPTAQGSGRCSIFRAYTAAQQRQP